MAILQTVIRNDSLALSGNSPRARPILAQVQPLHLVNNRVPDVIEGPPLPPGYFAIGLKELLYLRHNNRPFFTQNDSLFLIQQGLNKQKGLLDSTRFAPNDLTYNRSLSVYREIYGLSLPIFSQDSLRAYMQVDHYCRHMCGGGTGLLLVKKNGQWHVVGKEGTWVE
ncbi:hypothetical protein [Hymenobacter metallicola]|uniref:Uncharacterized protein n=1 Tax=Hymenobacter metallicola TaxID=2563114 RepID=A0A4Z0PT66_9BACT|nr:hypothetical protein [Hymenobacter metallicola]TGE20920.1 hypothetical protein E5K02_25300 [Hymenobacter metallicola]